MTALYLLAQEYLQAADMLADLDLPPEVVADTLEGLAGELEVKAQAVACMVRNLEVTASAIKDFEQQQKQRREAIERRADHLRDYLRANLEAAGIKQIEGPGIRIGWRASSAVVIDEPALIPPAFMRTPEPPPPIPDKPAIAAAIKAGADVPGAHIEHRRNLSIK